MSVRIKQRYSPEDRIQAFWLKVEKTETCWLWRGSTNQWGYGRAWWDQRLRPAHHVPFFLQHGRFPSPALLHRCDTPGCVRPSHTFEGDHFDNMRDMTAKGRGRAAYGDSHWTRREPERVRGERNGRAKLPDSAVIEIRELYATGQFTQKALGLRFGVGQSHISQLVLAKQRRL